MFEHLNPQPEDKIMALMKMYREDARDGKIDLGVGVYKTAAGVTLAEPAVGIRGTHRVVQRGSPDEVAVDQSQPDRGHRVLAIRG